MHLGLKVGPALRLRGALTAEAATGASAEETPERSLRSKSWNCVPPRRRLRTDRAPFVDPNWSYWLRFSASESTSYAPWISLNLASSPPLVGVMLRASFRYAFLISSAEAFLATPSVS